MASNQKPIIVMGAHGGIGEALARHLHAQGKTVVATARNLSDLTLLQTLGIKTFAVDVTRPDTIDLLIESAQDDGALGGLAYCIGSIVLKPLRNAQDQDFLDAFELNALGALRTLKRAEKALRAGRGSVVLFSTIAVQQGFTNHAVIAAAKGAVEGITRSLAAEWAPDVRINCIAPSLTQTAIAAPLLSSPPMKDAIEKMHPIPRLGQPEDSAALAAFLLDDQSSWITGQIMHVDGGRGALRVKG